MNKRDEIEDSLAFVMDKSGHKASQSETQFNTEPASNVPDYYNFKEKNEEDIQSEIRNAGRNGYQYPVGNQPMSFQRNSVNTSNLQETSNQNYYNSSVRNSIPMQESRNSAMEYGTNYYNTESGYPESGYESQRRILAEKISSREGKGIPSSNGRYGNPAGKEFMKRRTEPPTYGRLSNMAMTDSETSDYSKGLQAVEYPIPNDYRPLKTTSRMNRFPNHSLSMEEKMLRQQPPFREKGNVSFSTRSAMREEQLHNIGKRMNSEIDDLSYKNTESISGNREEPFSMEEEISVGRINLNEISKNGKYDERYRGKTDETLGELLENQISEPREHEGRRISRAETIRARENFNKSSSELHNTMRRESVPTRYNPMEEVPSRRPRHMEDTRPMENMSMPQGHMSDTRPMENVSRRSRHMEDTRPIENMSMPQGHMSDTRPMENVSRRPRRMEDTRPIENMSMPQGHMSDTRPMENVSRRPRHMEDTRPIENMSMPQGHMSDTRPIENVSRRPRHMEDTRPMEDMSRMQGPVEDTRSVGTAARRRRNSGVNSEGSPNSARVNTEEVPVERRRTRADRENQRYGRRTTSSRYTRTEQEMPEELEERNIRARERSRKVARSSEKNEKDRRLNQIEEERKQLGFDPSLLGEDGLELLNSEAILDQQPQTNIVKSLFKEFKQLLITVATAYGIVTFLTLYVVIHTQVSGPSMRDTLQDQDFLLIDKLSYHFNEPQRFDIVVFEHTMDEFYIKRVIGLPGETVQIVDGTIYINDEPIEENYGREKIQDAGLAVNKIYLGENEYFVLGDNRNQSTDSRSETVGLIQKKNIVGKLFIRVYPFDKFGTVE